MPEKEESKDLTPEKKRLQFIIDKPTYKKFKLLCFEREEHMSDWLRRQVEDEVKAHCPNDNESN